MKRLPASSARDALHSGGEIAFLDVREGGQFGEGHPLFAVPLSYSRLEARVTALVPRLDAPVILLDGGDGVAERAGRRMAALGYRDLALVEGGAAAWEDAGFPLYKGVNVPSKVLGELAEAVWHPATVTAEELARWRDEGRTFGLFDARPPAEYAKMRVPGAICLPNGELAHRISAAAETPIVVTCAGRTRGITGAIGLQLAGYRGPILALENGTQGWALAGFALERENEAEPYPAVEGAALADAQRRAADLRRRYGIEEVSTNTLEAWLRQESRTTFLFDVRSAEEARSDPVPAAQHAPSGQIVQATDQWVGVRRARLVLSCDGGLRSALAAFWLKQLGYDVAVAQVDDQLRALPAAERARPEGPPRLTGAEALAADARFVDVRASTAYRQGHVRSAVWTIRPRIGALGPGRVVLIGNAEAALAALDCREAGIEVVGTVGHEALVAAGAEQEATPDRPSDAEAIDYLFFVHDRHDGNLEASRRYLDWETGLVAQLDARERAEFSLIVPIAGAA